MMKKKTKEERDKKKMKYQKHTKVPMIKLIVLLKNILTKQIHKHHEKLTSKLLVKCTCNFKTTTCSFIDILSTSFKVSFLICVWTYLVDIVLMVRRILLSELHISNTSLFLSIFSSPFLIFVGMSSFFNSH